MLHLLNRLPNFIKHNMDVPVLERTFIDDIKRLIEDARLNTYAAINAVMLETYWNIGKRIVKQEQQGKSRAEYGTQLLKVLSGELSAAFGKGFSARNLRNYRQFYLSFRMLRFGTRVYQILHGRIFEPYCGLRTMRPASGI